MDDTDLKSLGIYFRPSKGNYLMQRFMRDLVFEPSDSPLIDFSSKAPKKSKRSTSSSDSPVKKRKSRQVTLDDILNETAAVAIKMKERRMGQGAKKQRLQYSHFMTQTSPKSPKTIEESRQNNSKTPSTSSSAFGTKTQSDSPTKKSNGPLDPTEVNNISPVNKPPPHSIRKFAILNNSATGKRSGKKSLYQGPDGNQTHESSAKLDSGQEADASDVSHPSANRAQTDELTKRSAAIGGKTVALENGGVPHNDSSKPEKLLETLASPIVSAKGHSTERKYGVLESTRISYVAKQEDTNMSQSFAESNQALAPGSIEKSTFVKPDISNIAEESETNQNHSNEEKTTFHKLPSKGASNQDISKHMSAVHTPNAQDSAGSERAASQRLETQARKPFKLNRDPQKTLPYNILKSSNEPSRAAAIWDKYFPAPVELKVKLKTLDTSLNTAEPLAEGEKYGMPRLLIPKSNSRRLKMICDYINTWSDIRKLNQEG